MSNHPEFSPASLRILQFKYALRVEVPPTESPALALQSYNTSELKEGALASIYSNFSYGAENGPVRLYSFKRSYSGAAVNGPYLLTPLTGGGVWVAQTYDALVYNQSENNGGAVTLTADAGDFQLVAPSSHSWNNGDTFRGLEGSARIEARVMLYCGATPGAVVTLKLQASSYDVGPSFATIATQSLTLLANQYAQVTLVGHLLNLVDNFWSVNVLGGSVAQTAYVTRTETDVLIKASNNISYA